MLKERASREFANGKVYVLNTEDGYPLEVTDTFLPYYTKDCINEHINELKNYHLGDRTERWMIGVSVMSGCPVHCKFCLDPDTEILMYDLSVKKLKDVKVGESVVSIKTVPERTFNCDTDLDKIESAEDFSQEVKKTLRLLSKRHAGFKVTVPEKCLDKIRESKVLNVFKRKFTGKLYTITLDDNTVIKMTDNHKVASIHKEVEDLGVRRFYEAKQLNKDMLVLTLESNTGYSNFIHNDFDGVSKNILDEVENRCMRGIKDIKVENVVDYEVCNIETEEHTYIANSVVVHNCATGALKRWRSLTSDEIVEQVKFILNKHPDIDTSKCKEFKINFTRMGEPALNWENTREAVEKIEAMLSNTRVHCYISTVGIKGTDFSWIKGNRTLQVSLHSLDEARRDELIPIKNKMTIEELGQIRTESDLKTTVNMTLVDVEDFDIEKLRKYFDPEYFFIKVSPINPNPISENNHMGKGVIKVDNLV